MTVLVTSPADLGALVREARERRGWTQTELGTRIGASRFWVAAFERGKPGAELGLSLHAAAAVGLRLRAERPKSMTRGGVALAAETRERGREAPGASIRVDDKFSIDLDAIVGEAPRTGSPTDDAHAAANRRPGPGARTVDR